MSDRRDFNRHLRNRIIGIESLKLSTIEKLKAQALDIEQVSKI